MPKKKSRVPTIDEVLKAMGVRPYSQLQIAINPKLRWQPRFRNISEVARILRVSRYQV